MKQKLYIVGAISGVKEWKGKFIAAKRYFEMLGHVVRTPLDYPEGLTQEQYMVLSCESVFWSDHVVVTKGYENSRGTKAEIALKESYSEDKVKYI